MVPARRTDRIGEGARIAVRAGLALLLLSGPAGCWGGGGSDPGESGAPAARAPEGTGGRLDAAWGRVIVAPAAKLPAAVAKGLDSPELLARAHTDDGRAVEMRVRTLRVKAGEWPELPPTLRRGWMPPVGSWSTVDEEEAKAAGPDAGLGARFAVIRMPPGTMGQGVWVGDERLEVNWLASSRSMMDRLSTLSWGSPLAEGAMESPVVRACVEAERASPFRRWRARMAMGLMGPSDGGEGEEREVAADAFQDAGLEEIAAQVEERWAVGLARLGEADARLYEMVRRALVRTVRVNGVVAPSWPTDQALLDDLVAGLLTPRATPRMVREAAERFLEALPRAVAWVWDDASGVDAGTLLPVVMLGIANLGEDPLAASARWSGGAAGAAAAELAPVPGRSVARVRAPAVPPDLARGRVAGLQKLGVRAADWIGTLEASPAPVGVQPPGVLMEPLALDWTLPAWVGGAAGEAARVPVAVTLIRTPSPNPRARGIEEGWVLYGQVQAGVTGTLRVWLGPQARSRSAIVVDLASAGAPPAAEVKPADPASDKPVDPAADGAAAPTPTPQPAAPAAARVRAFSVPIPPEAVAAGGRLLIGVDAEVGEGERLLHVAWPRPMFPWETAPARVALDLSGWGGVGAARNP